VKTKSIIPSAFGSALLASAILMLTPNLASATLQDVGNPSRVSRAAPSVGKHLSAQQMKATEGAFGMICSGDCNNGINGCGMSGAYPPNNQGQQCYCRSYFYHHLVCVTNYNPTVYSSCNNSANLNCYDYVYTYGACSGSFGAVPITTVPHPTWCCGV